MHQTEYKFSSKTISCYFNAEFSSLEKLVDRDKVVFITDSHIVKLHADKFEGRKVIVIKAGEEYKQQSTVDFVIKELIKLQADRTIFIVGVGGGVVTDVAGYAASVYMRGVKFAFVPTSILAMVDAAIGGKNGVDVGIYKNLVGVIRHPEFLLYDFSFLETLPDEEWVNGFAEIIKHACIKDAGMFTLLQENSLHIFKDSLEKAGELIRKNVEIKYNIVSSDEFETGERKLLNFGHTLGHAIENIYQLPHGHAVAIGMVAACTISEDLNEFSLAEKEMVMEVLKRYHLPVEFKFDKVKVWEILLMDKKKSGDTMNFVLLNKIGGGTIKSIPLQELKQLFNKL